MGQILRVGRTYSLLPREWSTVMDFAATIGMLVHGEVPCTPGGGCTESYPYCECDSDLAGIPVAKIRRLKIWVVSSREVRAALDTYQHWVFDLLAEPTSEEAQPMETVVNVVKRTLSRMYSPDAAEGVITFVDFLRMAEPDGFWVID